MLNSLAHKIRDFTFENSFVGALDGVERNTANTLMSMGWPKLSILLTECNAVVAQSHIAAGFPVHEGVNFGDSVFDGIYQEEHQAWRAYNCLGWYFDTCGEISTQKHSILSTIKKLKLVKGSVLAFTFSRNRMRINDYLNEKRFFVKEMNKILAGGKMELKMEVEHDYAGSFMFKRARESHMNSFVCSVQKINHS